MLFIITFYSELLFAQQLRCHHSRLWRTLCTMAKRITLNTASVLYAALLAKPCTTPARALKISSPYRLAQKPSPNHTVHALSSWSSCLPAVCRISLAHIHHRLSHIQLVHGALPTTNRPDWLDFLNCLSFFIFRLSSPPNNPRTCAHQLSHSNRRLTWQTQ